MESAISKADKRATDQAVDPAYWLDIEGELKEWHRAIITTEEVISLGGWDSSQGAIMIDGDNNEITLQPGQIVEIKPGISFSKRIRFKRG